MILRLVLAASLLATTLPAAAASDTQQIAINALSGLRATFDIGASGAKVVQGCDRE
jgi:hypothetical protein